MFKLVKVGVSCKHIGDLPAGLWVLYGLLPGYIVLLAHVLGILNHVVVLELRHVYCLACFLGDLAQSSLYKLGWVGSGNDTKGTQQCIQCIALLILRHLLIRQDLGYNIFVSICATHLVPYLKRGCNSGINLDPIVGLHHIRDHTIMHMVPGLAHICYNALTQGSRRGLLQPHS